MIGARVIGRLLPALLLARHAAAQSRPDLERQIYRIVIGTLADRARDYPGIGEGRVFLGPYALPGAMLPSEQGTPVGQRLSEALLREMLNDHRISRLCEPAPDVRCRGVDEGVSIHVTRVRWASPTEAHLVGVLVRVPTRRSVALASKTESAFLGFTLTRMKQGWAVSDPVPLADPRSRP